MNLLAGTRGPAKNSTSENNFIFFWNVPKIMPGPHGGCRTGLLLAWQETSLE
jgi:hypothetical protein